MEKDLPRRVSYRAGKKRGGGVEVVINSCSLKGTCDEK